MHPLIQEIEKAQRKESVPDFGPGDTVRVHVKVVEGGKERVQIFEGTVIFRKKGLSRSAFMVRKISNGYGVERTFLLHSPRVDKIEVTRRGLVRRAKLFYLRKKVGKAARIKREADLLRSRNFSATARVSKVASPAGGFVFCARSFRLFLRPSTHAAPFF